MGCVSSAYLNEEEGTIISHHIVSLTSSTYGLLTTLDEPPTTSQTPPASPPSPPPEVINSWELMAGLDPVTPLKPKPKPMPTTKTTYSLEDYPKRCPPGGGEDSVVLYTTTLRGIRKTFEDCNAVRAAVEGTGVAVRERDVSMDMGFRQELRELVKGTGEGPTVPRLFVRGRYIGGADAVLRIHEEGGLAQLTEGMPRRRDVGGVCDGCGGARFLPCFRCSGSRKVVVGREEKGKVVRCGECNENGLVVCPICC